MAKRIKRIKKVSSRPIGALIKKTVQQLKAARPSASRRAQKRMDLHIKVLNTCYASLVRDCKQIWVLPNPNL